MLRKIISLAVILSFTFSNVSFALPQNNLRQPTVEGKGSPDNLKREMDSVLGTQAPGEFPHGGSTNTPTGVGPAMDTGSSGGGAAKPRKDKISEKTVKKQPTRVVNGLIIKVNKLPYEEDIPDAFDVLVDKLPSLARKLKGTGQIIVSIYKTRLRRSGYQTFDEWLSEQQSGISDFEPDYEFFDKYDKQIAKINASLPRSSQILIYFESVSFTSVENELRYSRKIKKFRFVETKEEAEELLQQLEHGIPIFPLTTDKPAQAPMKDFPNEGLTGTTPTGVGPAMDDGSSDGGADIDTAMKYLKESLEINVLSDYYLTETVKFRIKELTEVALGPNIPPQRLPEVIDLLEGIGLKFEGDSLYYEKIKGRPYAHSPLAFRQEYDRLWNSNRQEDRDKAETMLAMERAAPDAARGASIYEACQSAISKINLGLRNTVRKLPPYTGAGDTAIHTALADAEKKVSSGETNLAKALLEELITDLQTAQKTENIEGLMAKWDEKYPSSLQVDLALADIPVAINEAEGLLDITRLEQEKEKQQPALKDMSPQTPLEIGPVIPPAPPEPLEPAVVQDFLKAVQKWQGTVNWTDADIEGIEKITVDFPAYYSEGEALLAGLKQRVGDKVSVTIRIRGADSNTYEYYKNLNSQLNLGFAIQPVVNIMESSSEYAGTLLRKGLPNNERYLFVIEELDNFEFQRQEETLAALVRSTASLGNNAKNVKVALVRKVAQDMVQPTDATPKILKDLLFGEKQIEVITPATITGEELRNELSSALAALRKA